MVAVTSAEQDTGTDRRNGGPDPLTAVDWPVRTERLVLRRARPGDAEATWAFRRLPEVQEWITTAAATPAAHHEHFTDPRRLAGTVIVERDGAVIGDLLIRVGDLWAQTEVADHARGMQAEIGWSLHPDHQGRGYATEAVRTAIDLCFGPMGLHRVMASCFTGSERSWRLMERVGMRREAHHVRDSLHRTRGWIDGYTYASLHTEWPIRPLDTPAD